MIAVTTPSETTLLLNEIMKTPKLDEAFALLCQLYYTGSLDDIEAAATVFLSVVKGESLNEQQQIQERGYAHGLPEIKPITNLLSKEDLAEMLKPN